MLGMPKVAVRNSSDVEWILKQCYSDSKMFDVTFLEDNFYSPFVDEVHGPIFEMIDMKKDKKQVAVCATRGIGKSTIARGKAAKAICFAEKRFIVYLGKSATHAEMQTENLKKDLMSPNIKEVWGSVKAKVPGDIDESWSKKSWVAMVGQLCGCGKTIKGECEFCGTKGDAQYTFVLPRGAGQQVRGLLWKAPDGSNLRPDLIIADDLEDSEHVDSQEWRDKIKEWFFADVMQSFSKLEKDWEMFYIDTLKHEDALMALLLEASDWDSLTIAACDKNYKSLAPAFMDDKEIMEMVNSYREKGLMDVFAREIMCMPISKEDAEFKPEYFQYYQESDKKFREALPKMANFLLVDPAKTAKTTSDATGMVVWGVDIESNMMYIRYAIEEKLHPDEMWDRIIDIGLQYKVWMIGIESAGLGEFATYPLRNELTRRGITIPVEELKAKRGGRIKEAKGFEAGKVQRIRSLSGFYRKGLIKHNKVGIGPYELELLGFPKSKAWHMIDCAAYISQVLDSDQMYFLIEGVSGNTAEDVEKEYEDLDSELEREEIASIGDWRNAP